MAVKTVLVEIGQIFGSFEGKFPIIGGAVPWLLLSESVWRSTTACSAARCSGVMINGCTGRAMDARMPRPEHYVYLL